ncbi:MAG: hypothetical protein ACLFTG_05475 [Alphaproteobacteria bacterium]
MTALVTALGVTAFALAFTLLRVPAWASESLAVAGRAQSALRDPALDDAAREAGAQAAARRLLYVFGVILVRSVAALAVAALPVVVADRLELVAAADVAAFSLRLDVILVASAVVVALWFLHRRRNARWR